jgi:hypothetical protein
MARGEWLQLLAVGGAGLFQHVGQRRLLLALFGGAGAFLGRASSSGTCMPYWPARSFTASTKFMPA